MEDLHVISEQEIKLHKRLREVANAHDVSILFDSHDAIFGPTDDDEIFDPMAEAIRAHRNANPNSQESN